MKFYLYIYCFLFSSLSFAQNKSLEYNRYLKIYNLLSYQKNTESWLDSTNSYTSSHTSLKIVHPTIAFGWKGKNQNINELELKTLFMNNSDDLKTSTKISNGMNMSTSGEKVFSSSISLRYEYIINLIKSSTCKFAPSVGLSINPYYSSYNIKPHTTLSFPSSDFNIGAKGFIIPRLICKYSSRCFFDLNIPLAIFDANQDFLKVKNPAIPVSSQRVLSSSFNFMPKQFSLRFGVGIKI